ncbi:uroporphyrinogen-III C-methyltransferase [Pseudobythopirellula maris]|uniref:uroporphyrinogen-III C-methyltransferase n=1 Tax=Pseudobythopirellula maris TaxID=2527991 RepID=UPI0018D483D2|nr:uroporphyrinogen-III C-methyltransferase [Pseudobythopirellula maris]
MFLVGAGPGDPGLLTIRGAQCLAEADVVLYDYLASPALVDLAPTGAERICLGRHGVGKIWTQQEINARMTADALDGKRVVRLKGGDPSVFGRLAEEIDACAAAGTPLEIVPGVTTALAAGAYAGVTVTDREQSSCVALVTGSERPGKSEEESLDFGALAAFPGTLVVYMGVTTAPRWSRALIDHGKPADTPVLLVRRCSHADQTTHDTTLGGLPDLIERESIRPPLVAIVGAVRRRGQAADWFTGRPLFGQTVLVTRPREQSRALCRRLADLGARVALEPAIEIAPPDDWRPVDDAIARLQTFTAVAFASQNGVEHFMGRCRTLGRDARVFAGCTIAAVGPATAEALRRYGLEPDVTPSRYNAEELAAAIVAAAVAGCDTGDALGAKALLVQANRSRATLAEELSSAGVRVESVIAYQSRDAGPASEETIASLRSGEIGWVTLTSPASAVSVVRRYGDALKGARLVAISPLTAAAAADHGAPADAIAQEATAEGIVRAILQATPPAAS